MSYHYRSYEYVGTGHGIFCEYCYQRGAKYINPRSGKYCCRRNKVFCPGLPENHKYSESGRKYKTFDYIGTGHGKVCKYCGDGARWISPGGIYCCENRVQKCPAIRKKNSEGAKRWRKENPDWQPMKKEKYVKKVSETQKENYSDNSRRLIYTSDYNTKNLVLYDKFAHSIDFAEEVRRDPKDENVLQVRCAYCGRWFTPNLSRIGARMAALNWNMKDNNEGRLYCSDACKQECPIFRQVGFPKGYKKATSRETQPELRQLVLKRDNYECQKCGAIEPLHCHHMTGVEQNPIESADVDNCITLCKKCHKFVHTQEGCKYFQLQRRKCG